MGMLGNPSGPWGKPTILLQNVKDELRPYHNALEALSIIFWQPSNHQLDANGEELVVDIDYLDPKNGGKLRP